MEHFVFYVFVSDPRDARAHTLPTIRGVWLGSSAANTPSFASVVQVGEVQGDWCTQQLPSAVTHFSAPAKQGR